jgi:hypothetical protein
MFETNDVQNTLWIPRSFFFLLVCQVKWVEWVVELTQIDPQWLDSVLLGRLDCSWIRWLEAWSAHMTCTFGHCWRSRHAVWESCSNRSRMSRICTSFGNRRRRVQGGKLCVSHNVLFCSNRSRDATTKRPGNSTILFYLVFNPNFVIFFFFCAFLYLLIFSLN